MVFIFRELYLFFVDLSGSYAAALLMLSISTTLIIVVLSRLIRKYPQREALVQSLMAPKLQRIKQESDPEKRHLKTVELYKRYHYHPILALRSAFPLLLQLPFLFAAYHMLSDLQVLQGVSFLFIKDLAAPDALLMGHNLLPVLMTLINMATALITPDFSTKDRVQAIAIATIFLILLYQAASALLIYWTANNLIFLFRSIYARAKYRSAIEPRQAGVDYRALLRKSAPGIKAYFALLSIFYLYQALALEDGFVFHSFTKYIPFLLAGSALWLMQILSLGRQKTKPARYMGLIVIQAVILTIALNVADYSDLPGLLNALAYAFILSSFAMGIFFLITKPKSRATRSAKAGISDVLLPALIVVLALIPAAHFARSNRVYLLGAYPYIYFIGIAAIALLNYLLLKAFSAGKGNRLRIALYAAVFNLLFIALPLIRFAFRSTSKVDIDFWLILALGMALTTLVNSRQRLLNLLRLSLIVLAVFMLSFLFFSPKIGSSFARKSIPQDLTELELNETPNIYLFVYDGIPNPRVFRDLDLPLDKLQKLMDEYDFKLYEDTYTLISHSLGSMALTLDFDDRHISNVEGKDIYAGNSRANIFLRNKGYQSRFILDNEYTGYAEITHAGLWEELYPPRSARESRQDYYLTLMRGILQGEMRFDTRGLDNWDEPSMQARKLEIIREDKPPSFVVNHYHYPGHSQNSGQCLPNETELWVERFERALMQMDQDFQAIQDYDPTAIVIALGDHGPYLTGDCLDLAAWSKEELTPELIWDRIGTMVAIRWPQLQRAEKYDREIITNHDIFPVLLAYLSDNELPLQYCPPDLYQGLRNPFHFEIEFERGQILP